MCNTQEDAFRKAKSASKGFDYPMLHAPHGDDDEYCWHYHPSTHHVYQDRQLKDLHYGFPGSNETEIRRKDRQLRYQ
jgi:hypothetical protein